MTGSSFIKRVGWTAAVLAVCTLAGHADAAQRGQRNDQRSAQRDDGPARGRDQQQRQQQQQQKQKQQAQSQRRTQQENQQQRQRADQQKQRQEAQRKQQQPSAARVTSAAPNDRGDNWGVNAQRNKLAQRQEIVRTQEKKLEVKRIEERKDLRQAKEKFEDKAQREKQELRARDNRLDARADALRHASQHTYNPPAYGHSFHKPDYDRHDGHHDGHNKLGIRIGFGSYYPSSYYYNSFSRHACCTGGYWTWRWVPPLTVTRYDDYGNPYTEVIRDGYHQRVWVPHYCRTGLHIYYRY